MPKFSGQLKIRRIQSRSIAHAIQRFRRAKAGWPEPCTDVLWAVLVPFIEFFDPNQRLRGQIPNFWVIKLFQRSYSFVDCGIWIERAVDALRCQALQATNLLGGGRMAYFVE